MKWTLLPASDYHAHAARWQELNRASVDSPLLDADFVQPLLSEFGAGREWLAVCDDGGRTVAMALLQKSRQGAWQTFQPSQQPMGMWLQLPDQDLSAVMDSLLRSLPGMPLVLGLTQFDSGLHPRPADGAQLRTADYISTARITIAGTFEEYWAARGKNLRTNMKKQRARLAKEGIASRMEVLRAPADMAQAVADYGVMESAGWKAGGGTAIHPDNDQGRFYRSMLENFARRGAASVHRYWFGDRLVALNLCIEGGGAKIMLKTTYDESLSSQYSPAFLLCEETCQALFHERGAERLEFYGRVMEWHLRWTDEVRSMYHITHYRWPALKSLHTLVNKLRGGGKGQPAPAAEPVPPAAVRHTEPSTE